MSNPIFDGDTSESLHDLVAALRRQRDHLRIQANLGKMELRDEWEDVESKWHAFEHQVEEANEDARHSLHEIAQEIAETYKKLKHKLD